MHWNRSSEPSKIQFYLNMTLTVKEWFSSEVWVWRSIAAGTWACVAAPGLMLAWLAVAGGGLTRPLAGLSECVGVAMSLQMVVSCCVFAAVQGLVVRSSLPHYSVCASAPLTRLEALLHLWRWQQLPLLVVLALAGALHSWCLLGLMGSGVNGGVNGVNTLTSMLDTPDFEKVVLNEKHLFLMEAGVFFGLCQYIRFFWNKMNYLHFPHIQRQKFFLIQKEAARAFYSSASLSIKNTSMFYAAYFIFGGTIKHWIKQSFRIEENPQVSPLTSVWGLCDLGLLWMTLTLHVTLTWGWSLAQGLCRVMHTMPLQFEVASPHDARQPCGLCEAMQGQSDLLLLDPLRPDPLLHDPLRHDPLLQDPLRHDPLLQDPLRNDPLLQDPQLYDSKLHDPQILKSNIWKHQPLLQHLGFQDFLSISHSSPGRRAALLALSQPGGHPRVWQSVSQSALQAIHSLTQALHTHTRTVMQAVGATGDIYSSAHLANKPGYEHHSPDIYSSSSHLTKPGYSNLDTTGDRADMSIHASISPPKMRLDVTAVPLLAHLTSELPDARARRLFGGCQMVQWAVEGLSHMAKHSYTEDKYGVVQGTLPGIIMALLDLHEALERHFKVSPLARRPQGSHDASPDSTLPHRLLAVTRTAVYRVAGTYREHMDDLHLSPEYKKKIAGFNDFLI